MKTIHELGHGLTCRRLGGEVHEIGVLVILFTLLLGFTGCASRQQTTTVAPEMKGNYHPPARSQYLNEMTAK